MSLGFRSSFNFIPEGPYRVTPELRAWLTTNGFEVGVHDLHHDGNLFASRRGFLWKAKRINHYLKEWQARGYRSGFMLRNLDWLHDLEIAYDSSTFDTDPFEPQPDGVGTIFPYWIDPPKDAKADPSASAKQGYAELPYTLPQDSTLFLVLQEKTPKIWRQKLDWISTHGGMALLNVHPDYLPEKSGRPDTLHTIENHYVAWLHYVKKNYSDSYWHVLPREMADFVHQWKNKPVALNTHNYS
jgi:hypothetical protein